jgi:amino acid permease
MKTMYKTLMFVNLFALGLIGTGAIYSLFRPETEFNFWNVIAMPLFLFFYFLYRKKYRKLVLQEEQDRLVQQNQSPRKKKRK